jgi:TolA-binding protein
MSSLSNPLKGAYQKVCLFRGEQLIQEGKPSDGTAMMDKSLRYPIDKGIEARAYFWKGEHAHDQQHYNESIRLFDQYFKSMSAARDVPVNQELYIGHYNQGYNYLRLGDYPKAQQHFEECLSGIRNMPAASGQVAFVRHQLYPDAVLRTGDCAFKRNQYEVANQYYQEAIRHKYQGHDYAEYQSAIIKGLQNKPTEKVTLLEGLIQGNAASPWADDALFQIGNTLHELNQIPQSIGAYERLVKYYPKSTLLEPALLKLGLISYNAGKFDQALTYYQSIFTYNPSPETAREAMSAIQEIYVNEWDQPDKYFAFAATIPGFEVSGTEQDSILYSAAEHHYAQGDYARAAESFAHYLKANPTGFYALKARFLQAESYSLLKRYDEALNAYEAVIKLGQSYYLPEALHKAALISYHQKEDMERAFTYYRDYIPHAPDAELQYESILGALRSAYKLEREDAVRELASRIVTHGRVTQDHKALAYYYRAKIAYKQSNYEAAYSDLNEVVKINSTELAAESRYLIADIYARHGDYVIAAKLAEEAARTNVGYPFWVAKSLILLSDIHFQQQDLLNARAILEAVIENMEGEEAIQKEAEERLDRVKTAEQNQSRLKSGSADTLELITPTKKD